MSLQYRAAEAAALAKGDDSLGPTSGGLFDFTLPFEASFFTIAPAALAIVLTPYFVRNAFRRSKYMQPGMLLVAKLVFVVALVGTELANIIVWKALPVPSPKYTLAASIVSFAASLCIVVILYAEHMHSYRSSTFLSLFFSVNILFDIVKSRSYFIRDGLGAFGGMAVVALCLKLALVILEEFSKRHLISKEHLSKSLSPESVSGFWNRSFFLWLNSTLNFGFRHVMRVEDLPLLGPEFNAEELHNRFRLRWNKADKTSKGVLSITLLRTLFWEYASPIPPRLCFTAFTLTQPFLFRRIISGIENSDLSLSEALGLFAATALVYIGIGLSRGYYKHMNNRVAIFARCILGATIYDKSLKLSLEQLQEFEAVTLSTTDVESIEAAIIMLHNMWASAVELGIATYILTTLIGPVSFAVLLVTLLSTWASSWAAQRMAKARQDWNAKIAIRVAATSNVLAQLKSVKETGLKELMMERIELLRAEEIKASLEERKMRIILHAIDMAANGIAPVVAIAGALFWLRSEDPFTIAKIFTTLALVAIVTAPLTQLLLCLPQCSTGNACITRVQRFLILEEMTDAHHNSFETYDGSLEQLRASLNESVGIVEKPSRPSTRFGMELVHATLVSHDKTSRILNDVTLQMLDSCVNMVIGPVGCGKTVLLKIIIGEVKLTDGFVLTCRGTVAYCGQDPWLQNLSFRDSILGQSEFNRPWLTSVMHACALDEDVLQLADGENTLVGSGGSSLSGGQKQRLALARAVYSHPSILLVDDALSSTDITTAKKIMDRLFGKNGIVRRTGAAVVYTTNILEHLTVADTVFTFEAGGRMRKTSNNFSTLVQDQTLLQWLQQHPGSFQGQSAPGEQSSEAPQAVAPPDQVAEQPDYQRQRGDFSLYTYYLKFAGWRLIVPWVLTLAMAAVAERMPQIFVRIWMENAPHNAIYFVGFAFLGVSSAVLLGCSLTFYYLKIVPKTSINLHRSLLHSVMNATLGFISTTDSGSLLNRFSQDIAHVSQQLPMAFMEFSYMIMAISIDLAIVSSGATYAAILVPLFGLALYGIQHFYLRTSRQLRHLHLETRTPLYTLYADTASGIEHIRAFHWQAQFMWHNLALLEHSQRPAYYMYCIQVWLGLVLDMCVLGIALFLAAFGLFVPSSTSATAIGLSLVNLVSFSESSSLVVRSWVKLETSLGSIYRTRSFNETVRLEKPPSGPRGDKPAEDWPGYGSIDLVGVTARYNETDNNSRSILDNVSLTVQAGQKIGVLGRTGSGKSSLVMAILNFLDYSGTITIDGRDIRAVSHDFLRSRITTISQDGVELAGSLRLNLDPFDDPDSTHRLSDETLIDLLKEVGLWERMKPLGDLDTKLSKFKLSGGEKQLLGIARAILRKQYASSRIVLMDEATSKMDVETDRRIQKVMAKAFKHSTVITVAHRLHCVEDADVILEIQSGRIIKSLDRASRRRNRASGSGSGTSGQSGDLGDELAGELDDEQSGEQDGGRSDELVVEQGDGRNTEQDPEEGAGHIDEHSGEHSGQRNGTAPARR